MVNGRKGAVYIKHPPSPAGGARWLAVALLAAGSLLGGTGGCFVQAEALPPRPDGGAGGTGGTGGGGSGGSGGDGWDGLCGNESCDASETAGTCPEDCTVCGDGVCSVTEDTGTCAQDCPVCGDDVCAPLETSATCAGDCDPMQCTQKADFATCAGCFAEQFPAGAQLYGELSVCVVCEACYTICDGASYGCPMAPAMKDACDGSAADPASCQNGANDCFQCATGSTCTDEVAACLESPECATFVQRLNECPGP